ncbi:hypothetical protein DRN58_02695, partial [Thermococci archaeon]
MKNKSKFLGIFLTSLFMFSVFGSTNIVRAHNIGSVEITCGNTISYADYITVSAKYIHWDWGSISYIMSVYGTPLRIDFTVEVYRHHWYVDEQIYSGTTTHMIEKDGWYYDVYIGESYGGNGRWIEDLSESKAIEYFNELWNFRTKKISSSGDYKARVKAKLKLPDLSTGDTGWYNSSLVHIDVENPPDPEISDVLFDPTSREINVGDTIKIKVRVINTKETSPMTYVALSFDDDNLEYVSANPSSYLHKYNPGTTQWGVGDDHWSGPTHTLYYTLCEFEDTRSFGQTYRDYYWWLRATKSGSAWVKIRVAMQTQAEEGYDFMRDPYSSSQSPYKDDQGYYVYKYSITVLKQLDHITVSGDSTVYENTTAQY